MKLRPFTTQDAPRIALLANDEGISRWTLSIPHPYTLDDAHDWLSSVAENPLKHPYAIVIDGEVAGCVSYWTNADEDIEVGYWVGRDYWGSGVASRALGLLLQLDDFPQAARVVAKIKTGNAASEKVLLNNGFKPTTAESLAITMERECDEVFCKRMPVSSQRG